MNFFRRSFQRHCRVTSATFSGRTKKAIASSAIATCYLYVNGGEHLGFLKDNDGKNSEDAGSRNWIRGLSSASAPAITQCQDANSSDNRPRLVFLGTGSSTGCPKPICAMKFRGRDQIADSAPARAAKPDPTSCQTSFRALVGGDPKTNRDYRNNPCLLIHHYDEHTKQYKNILIDVGKTFRETALRWFPIHGIKSLDAIILTHHHMDAAAGLDDVRGFQRKIWIPDTKQKEEIASNQEGNPNPGRYVGQSIPLYMSDFCYLNLQRQFPWLLPNKSGPSIMPQQAKGRPEVKRHVASFDVTLFKDYEEETLLGAEGDGGKNGILGSGFKMVPLPVWHGDDLISHGFAFSLDPEPSTSSRPLNVVYLSDISRMVPKTLEYIQNELPPTDVLIIDSLLWEKPHPVHFSMEQAVDLARTLKPRMGTYLIGMSCDNFLPHDQMNAYLAKTYGKGGDDCKKTGGPIIMAHDGLIIDLPEDKKDRKGKESYWSLAKWF